LNGIVALLMWIIPTVVPLIALNNPQMPQEQQETLKRDMRDILDNRDTFGLQGFFQLTGMATAIGVMIIGQGAIIGEKESGTAAWVLSCPVTRAAFVLSKCLSLGTNALIVTIGFQGPLAYTQVSLAKGDPLPLLPFLGGLGLLSLHLLYYLALTLMLGTLCDRRAPVIGIPMAVLIGQSLLGNLVGSFIPWFPLLLPQSLVGLGLSLAQGQALLSPVPIVATLIPLVTFVWIAVQRFARTL
jgi:ABC-2 type transport system permease protein